MVVEAGGWIGVYHDITNLFWGNCLVEMNRVFPVILLAQQVCLNLVPVALGALLLLLSNIRQCASFALSIHLAIPCTQKRKSEFAVKTNEV